MGDQVPNCSISQEPEVLERISIASTDKSVAWLNLLH